MHRARIEGKERKYSSGSCEVGSVRVVGIEAMMRQILTRQTEDEGWFKQAQQLGVLQYGTSLVWPTRSATNDARTYHSKNRCIHTLDEIRDMAHSQYQEVKTGSSSAQLSIDNPSYHTLFMCTPHTPSILTGPPFPSHFIIGGVRTVPLDP